MEDHYNTRSPPRQRRLTPADTGWVLDEWVRLERYYLDHSLSAHEAHIRISQEYHCNWRTCYYHLQKAHSFGSIRGAGPAEETQPAISAHQDDIESGYGEVPVSQQRLWEIAHIGEDPTPSTGRLSKDKNFSSLGSDETEDDLDERGLSTTVGTNDAEDRFWGTSERDVAEHPG